MKLSINPTAFLKPDSTRTDGVQVEREAYPLEFDPQTWFVLQYHGEEFVGFDFSFRQPMTVP